MLTIALVKHKEEMELVTECLKIKEKFFKVQIKKNAWHAKSLSFEVEVQLFKEQKHNNLRANETREKILLEKI
jgi:hypothetical protein